jgi:hypothetical protein
MPTLAWACLVLSTDTADEHGHASVAMAPNMATAPGALIAERVRYVPSLALRACVKTIMADFSG